MLQTYLIIKLKELFLYKNDKLGLLLIVLFFTTKFIAQTPELVSPEAFLPTHLTEYDGKLFFNARDADGKEWLWSTDGVTTIKHSGSATASHPGSQPRDLIVFNGQLIFSAVLEESSGWHRELFEFDGTEPSLLKNIFIDGESHPTEFAEFNGELYFSADNGKVGTEPWKTDGTEGGTQLLANIALKLDHSNPEMYFEYNNKLLFTAEDSYIGRELYITDGTTEGTALVKEIKSGFGDSFINEFTAFNDKVYFTAYDNYNARELWVTDGTGEGTYMVKDISSQSYSSDPIGLTVFKGKLYFTAGDETHGRELWRSDGTEEGTVLFKEIREGLSVGGNPVNFTECNGKLYFGASNGNPDSSINNGLYETDGTVEGTVLVKGMPYPIRRAFTFDQKIYFESETQGHGGQFWVSDGTAAGTKVILFEDIMASSPIYLGPYPTERSHYKVANGTLYYTANYDGSGIRLYKLNTNTMSVDDYTKGEFLAYPNPVKDVMHFQLQDYTIQKIDLFSITGQRLKSWDAQPDIDMSEFAPGSYFVKITTDEAHTVVKQIIKN